MKEGIKILVAYDGSVESANAVRTSADLAKALNGSITVLNVYWDVSQVRYEGEVQQTERISVMDEGSLRILDDLEPMLKEKGVKYEFQSERDPNIPRTIMRVAERGGFDCIALGSRGLGGARAWLMGSVSSRIISDSICPVIVV